MKKLLTKNQKLYAFIFLLTLIFGAIIEIITLSTMVLMTLSLPLFLIISPFEGSLMKWIDNIAYQDGLLHNIIPIIFRILQSGTSILIAFVFLFLTKKVFLLNISNKILVISSLFGIIVAKLMLGFIN